ncbi:MAG: SurA N-terminal domain-containing protein [Candidatus Cryptobacteroides sp.]
MREKFGVLISVIIALSLLYFIAPMDDILRMFDKPQNVGEIAGTGISYEDYQAEVAKFTTINEITTGSSVQNEQTQTQIRNAAWQSLLDRYMFFKNCDKAGIRVSDAEVAALFAGEHVSPMIAQNPLFADETGAFSPQRVKEIDAAAQSDPNLKAYWDYLKSSLRTQQYYSKYAALFTSSALYAPSQIESIVAESNLTADIQLVSIPYGYERDTTVEVSSKEIKDYYENHKKDYKQQANRDIEYAVFEVKPSQKDIAEAADAVESVIDEFATTDNLKSFLLKYSDRPLSEYWYRKGELSTINSEIDAFAFSGAKGVSKIFNDKNSYYAARVIKSANIPDSVYVKHILLQGDDAAHKADSLCKVIAKKPASFQALAAEFSADQNSQYDGEIGNIGWMTQTYMIPGLESVITAQVGKPYVVRSQYGTHVVLVSKTTKPMLKKQVAILEKTAVASKETYSSYYAQANTLASLSAGTYEGYVKAVDSLGVYSHRLNNVLESTSTYGAIDHAREVTRWVFDAKKGKTSNIITVDNKYFFVVALKEVRKEGYKDIKEVAPVIQNTLYTEKRNAHKTEQIAAQIAGLGSIEEVAAALSTEPVSRKDIAFSPMSAPAVEPAVLGAILKTETGALSAPVQGARGVYVFQLERKEPGAFFTEDDARLFSSQKAQYSSQMIFPVMQEAAGVVDNRARYF